MISLMLLDRKATAIWNCEQKEWVSMGVFVHRSGFGSVWSVEMTFLPKNQKKKKKTTSKSQQDKVSLHSNVFLLFLLASSSCSSPLVVLTPRRAPLPLFFPFPPYLCPPTPVRRPNSSSPPPTPDLEKKLHGGLELTHPRKPNSLHHTPVLLGRQGIVRLPQGAPHRALWRLRLGAPAAGCGSGARGGWGALGRHFFFSGSAGWMGGGGKGRGE